MCILIQNGEIAETAMSSTRRVVKIAERYNKKIHVLHVTTKEEVDFLAMHKKNVTFETTPQHLTLYAPECYNKLGTYAQMNPPLRTKDHYDRLWVAIKNNIVDVLGSDHAPHTKENKKRISQFTFRYARSADYFSSNVRSCKQ